MRKLLINDSELAKYKSKNLNHDEDIIVNYLAALKEQQLGSWKLFSQNHSQLSNVETKEYDFTGTKILVQHNPARITSTSAKVDSQSIKNRACFLCTDNLPQEQRGLLFIDKYLALCNPFPIFDNHFTLPDLSHSPQLISNRMEDMLKLSEKLHDRFAVFYNGPACGASAPDHFHFQSIEQNKLPIIKAIKDNALVPLEKKLLNNTSLENLEVETIRFLKISSNNSSDLLNQWKSVFKNLAQINNSKTEPLINLVLFSSKNAIHLVVFPREKHRPKEFYNEGKNKIVVSPAAVDLGGVMIVPRKEDFERIDLTLVQSIYDQVLFSKEKINKLFNSISS